MAGVSRSPRTLGGLQVPAEEPALARPPPPPAPWPQSVPGAAAPALPSPPQDLPREGPKRHASPCVADSRRTQGSAPTPEVSARELRIHSQRRLLGTNFQVTFCELQRPLGQISPQIHHRPTRKGDLSAGTGQARGQFETRGRVTRRVPRLQSFLGMAKGGEGFAI